MKAAGSIIIVERLKKAAVSKSCPKCNSTLVWKNEFVKLETCNITVDLNYVGCTVCDYEEK